MPDKKSLISVWLTWRDFSFHRHRENRESIAALKLAASDFTGIDADGDGTADDADAAAILASLNSYDALHNWYAANTSWITNGVTS